MENEERQGPRFIRVTPRHSIKTKILVFALLATIIPSISLGIVSYLQNRRLLHDKIANDLQNAAAQASGELELWLKARSYDLKVFSSSYVISENLQRLLETDRSQIETLVAADRIRSYLQSVNARFTDFGELMLVSLIGEPLVTTGGEKSVFNLPKQWFRQIENGKLVIGPAYKDPALGVRVITLGHVIKSASDQALGILVGKLNLDVIMRILKQKTSRGVDELYLTDNRGFLVVSSEAIVGRPPRSKHATDLLASGSALPEASFGYRNYRDRPVTGIGRRIPGTDWAVFAEVENAGAFAGIIQSGKITFVLLGMLVLFVGLSGYILGQSIVRPLQRLSAEASRVAAGDLNADVPIHGSSEISYLAQVFNHMVASLRHGQSVIAEARDALLEKNRELHQLSITDGLTGLFNRKHLMDLFDMEMARKRRYNTPFSIMIADIDHFKRINDTYGHLAGDSVLRRVADTFGQVVRECDHVGRYGGEEFMIILPNSDMSGTMEMARRIREAVEQIDFYNDGKGFSISISIGVSECRSAEESPEGIISRADGALYQAKENGRNQVIGR